MNLKTTVLKASEIGKKRIFELHDEIFHQEIEERWGWDDQWQKENFDKEWERDVFKVAKHKEQVIGYVHFTKETDKIYLQNIGIVPEFRNKGLGSFLLKRILKEAQKLGIAVELSVHTKNEVALRLYKKYDFEIIESKPKEFLMRLNNESNKAGIGISSSCASRSPRLSVLQKSCDLLRNHQYNSK